MEPNRELERDYAIIGSGITGMSVAKSLLERHPSATITIFEARTLCSGATGRNGGQMAANVGEEYAHLADAHGPEMAGKIVSFTFHNLQKMQELIKEYDAEELSEMQRLKKLRAFLTEDSFEGFQKSIARLESDHPSWKGLYTILDKETLIKVGELMFGRYVVKLTDVRNMASTEQQGEPCFLQEPCGPIDSSRRSSPTSSRSPNRLTIETHTPVESVQNDSSFITPTTSVFPYTIQTPRGPSRVANVVYCTNGYSGHLIPELRGHIHPFKGTMTVQDPGNSVPNQGQHLSWGFHYPPTYDPTTKESGYGLYYLGQSAKTGYFYFGGENTRIEDAVSADDSFVGSNSVLHLQSVLPKFFGQRPGSQWKLVSSWSGIMGFSADGLPLIGRLSSSLTGRNGKGEWIAAAFNGYGMANCLMCGDALVSMILGEGSNEWLPGAYELSESRLQNTLATSESISALTPKL
ncbi:FAD dependent oxidoreductase [Penicillium chermesinum]|uniref:FAD dependent oxidoreductase n=1 Tax=Penicillium chermesinum TaxID=63820 RepID=A0A9W9TE67_9EURO|nr:FAD dependent oxidoreductase [Penicillium chermesinum]KAJ5219542.1 FAD dependent oxidoreductase [Penicillium chermesinum]